MTARRVYRHRSQESGGWLPYYLRSEGDYAAGPDLLPRGHVMLGEVATGFAG